ncbi:sigma 54-interacting transcriptional regulator [Clostridium tyrobutyricum]|uniref:sigma-54 interaction domain-containing protein n=1 Tax=Clostridium tyrobutyricum TaxID=1519 RepID=UPI001C38921A|nr:sigma 54-interacting transcriptional regulator [Clostridium tyrobutyricum]MBV4419549.1 sigma 54-interacting transcriptional regulator [Clostridium tyrobutyricum]
MDDKFISNNSLLNSTFKSIFQSVYDGLIITDDKFNIKKANSTALKIFNIKEDILYNTNLKNILKDTMLNSIIITGENIFNADCIFHLGNKKIRCIVNIVPIKLEDKVLGIVLSIKDTKRLHKIVNNVVGYKASYTFHDIITRSAKMEYIVKLAKKASNTDCTILIEGKSGTGKEVFAQSIHNYSNRHNGPFVAVNCAAIPRELVESELFGYEKGAFTGASKGGYPGKFELADGGTIFLDEIGELPLDIQSKLLRVLDNLKIVRVGATYEKSIDVRIIAATNKLLKDEIKNRNFRGDLYYRLSVLNLNLIPLQERKEDIEILARHFIDRLNFKNPNFPKYLDNSYIGKLILYNFPGNIRELRNIVERSYYLCEDLLITDKYLIHESINLDFKIDPITPDIPMPLEKVEKAYISNALKYFHGNASETAHALKIGKATIYRKINKYNIDIKALNS